MEEFTKEQLLLIEMIKEGYYELSEDHGQNDVCVYFNETRDVFNENVNKETK